MLLIKLKLILLLKVPLGPDNFDLNIAPGKKLLRKNILVRKTERTLSNKF